MKISIRTRAGMRWDYARNRLAGKIAAAGSLIHAGLIDLALSIEPRLAIGRPLAFRPRPWAGLAIIGVLACGLLFIGFGSVDVIRAVLPTVQQREATP